MDAAHARELLDRERARVERDLAELTGESGGGEELSHVDQHPGDDASELSDRELDEGLVEQLREQLGAIERAQQRLANGTYGRSIESDVPIPDARLEAIPWAERTVEEQAAHDRGV